MATSNNRMVRKLEQDAARMKLEEQIRAAVEKVNDLSTALMKVPEAEQWPKFVELWEELQKLRKLQDPHHKLSVAAASSKGLKDVKSTVEYDYKTALIDLLKWLKKKGAKIDGAVPVIEETAKVGPGQAPKYKAVLSIAPANSVEGNGVFVTRDAPAGEILIEVPRELFMTTESIEDSLILKDMLKDDLIADVGSIQLAIKLIYERYKDHSEWEPYIRALPRTYTTVYYWSLEDIERVKGTPIFRDVVKTLTIAVRAYYEAYLAVFVHEMMRKSLFTYDIFIWALSAVYSRQNMVPSLETIKSPEYQSAIAQIRQLQLDAKEGKTDQPLDLKLPEAKSVLALIPGFDMFNHEPGPSTSDFVFENNHLSLKSMKPLKTGEQAYMNYGDRPNSELLLQQGFVPNVNPTDHVLFYMGLPSSDPLRDQKIAALKSIGMTFEENGLACLPLLINKLAPATLLFMRVLVCNDAALLTKDALLQSLTQQTPLQPATDANARKFYSLKCQQFLNSLPENILQQEAVARKSTPADDSENIARAITLYLASQHQLFSSNLALLQALP
jgi:hypothetical protein